MMAAEESIRMFNHKITDAPIGGCECKKTEIMMYKLKLSPTVN
jgi:hypothetical protein